MASEKIVERLAQYKKLTENIKKLEDALDQVKKMRSEVAKTLLEENGKEQLYDLGDGVKLFVSATKIGTYFLAPRKRRGKGGGKKKATKKAIKDGKVVDQPVTGEVLPDLAQREGDVIEPGGPAPSPEPEAKPNVIEASATLSASGTVTAAPPAEPEPKEEPVQATPPNEAPASDGSEDDFDPMDYIDDENEPEADSPPEEPEPASTPDPEPKAAPEASPPTEVDALEAALAELQPDKT